MCRVTALSLSFNASHTQSFIHHLPSCAGEGDAGQRGGPPGDLYVFLTVEADRQFRREGIDLYTDLNVDYLGACMRPRAFLSGCLSRSVVARRGDSHHITRHDMA